MLLNNKLSIQRQKGKCLGSTCGLIYIVWVAGTSTPWGPFSTRQGKESFKRGFNEGEDKIKVSAAPYPNMYICKPKTSLAQPIIQQY